MLSSAEIAGISGGGALLVGGAVWRVIVLSRRRRRLDRALADPDPITRIATLDLLAERGVSGHLGTLVERILLESDPRVQTALVRTVIRTQWEPNADQRVIVLRSWATRVAANLAARAPLPGDDERVGGGGGPKSDRPISELPPGRESADEAVSGDATTEPEFEQLAEREQRVMDWLLSPEAAAEPPPSHRNGAVQDPLPARADRPDSVAKAEGKAIDLLRAAGYGVTPQAPPGEGRRMGQDASSATRGTRTTSDEAQLLRELRAQQDIRTELLEEMIRRVRAENARLEIELGRLSEHPRN